MNWQCGMRGLCGTGGAKLRRGPAVAGIVLLAAAVFPWAASYAEVESSGGAVATQPVGVASSQPSSVMISGPVARPAYSFGGPFYRPFVFRLDGAINSVTVELIRTHLETAVSKQADVVVMELNTPGGELGAAMEIAELIKGHEGKKVVWVNREAISAGALISLAFDVIVMHRDGKIGDCAPILMMGELGATEREKIETYIRAEFREGARRHGIDRAVAEAMVTASAALYLLQHRTSGELRAVRSEEMLVMTGQASAEAAGRSAVPESDRGAWGIVEQISKDGQLLTLLSDEAMLLNVSKAIASNRTELGSVLDVRGEWMVGERTWSMDLAEFLVSPGVRAVLSVLAILLFYLAIQTPGFGLPEIALVAVILLGIIPPYITGLANWAEVLLILIGVCLVLVELLVLPGFGVAGLLGLLLMFVGLVLTYAPDEPGQVTMIAWPTLDATWEALWKGTVVTLLGATAGLVGLLLMIQWMPRNPLLKRLIPAHPGLDGSIGSEPYFEPSRAGRALAQVGDVGTCTTELRPAGKMLLGGRLVDVVSHGGFVARGTQVRVVLVEGNKVTVEPV